MIDIRIGRRWASEHFVVPPTVTAFSRAAALQYFWRCARVLRSISKRRACWA